MLTRRLPGVYFRGRGFGCRCALNSVCSWASSTQAPAADDAGIASVRVARYRSASSPGRRRGAAPHRGERWQSGDLPSYRALWNLEFERAVLVANYRVALVAQLVKIPIVDPNILRELILSNEARADDESGDAALDSSSGALRQMWTVSSAATNHAAAINLRGRVAGSMSANMRAERDRITERILLLVIEVIVAFLVGPERRIVRGGASTSGAPLRQRPMSFARSTRALRRFLPADEEVAEPVHMPCKRR